jgi:thiol-disulfide isomerase/thioredoxin
MGAKKLDGQVGWVVQDANGTVLRKFVDTNGDNIVDQWCYFKDGLEVYRDIDGNFNGKPDQCRWFHTAGSRWGIDKNEDGRVDSWKAISAEEVSSEVVAAIANGDKARFLRVAITPDDVESLGLGSSRAKQVREKAEKLEQAFAKMASQQKEVSQTTKWMQFSGNKPGIVPAGTDGSTKDLRVYENVVAIVETGDKHSQVQIGTLVQIGDGWRVIDAPEPISSDTQLAASGFFFQTAMPDRAQATGNGPAPEAQKLIDELGTLDAAAGKVAAREERLKLISQRADLLEKIVDQTTKAEERTMWVRQLADMIGAAVQNDGYSDGAKRLESLFDKLNKTPADKELAAYVRFRQLAAQYGLAISAPGADFAKVQGEWLKKLEEYVGQYPTSPDTAEAMLQLAISQEFAGQEEECKKWYGRIVKDFPKSPAAAKAAGAQVRLESVGKTINFQGRNPKGGVVDLAKYRGQVVLIQYWATWCDPCKADMAVLKELYNKYNRSGFTVVGVNLDTTHQDMDAYLADSPLPWPQIFEDGGLDSRPANELGVLTLPMMLLIDQQGKVVDRNIHATELEKELKRLLR